MSEVINSPVPEVPEYPVFYQDGNPAFELGAKKQAFHVVLPNRTEYLVHLVRPEDNVSVKALYRENSSRMKALEGNKISLFGGGTEHYRKFFKRYFAGMTQLDGSPLKSPAETGAQMSWIESRPGLRIQEEVVRSGLLFVGIPTSEASVAGSDTLEDVVTSTVNTYVRVYDLQSQKTIRVPVSHTIRELTEKDNQHWLKATSNTEMDAETNEFERVENYDLIEQLYRSIVMSVGGAFLNGKVCDEKYQKEWVAKIPYSWMHTVTQRVFRGVQLKNAR